MPDQYVLTRVVDGAPIRFQVGDLGLVIAPMPWSALVPAAVIAAIEADSPELQRWCRWTPAGDDQAAPEPSQE